jgi:hypothetical protein
MQWNAMQLTAKQKGWLVYAVNQSQTAPLTQPGPWGSATDGFCIGLAAEWASLMYQGRDLPFSNQECDNPPWQSTMAQNLSDSSTGSGQIDFWKAALSPFACSMSGFNAVRRNHAPSAAFFCQVAFQAYGCYGITMVGPSSAHAVAIRNGRDGMHLFDANFFHLRINNPAIFQDAVDWWLNAPPYAGVSSYAATFMKESYIFGIRPPIHLGST